MNWKRSNDSHRLSHVSITRGSFSAKNERAIAAFRTYCEKRIRDPHTQKLFHLAALAVLEDASYTRKDGQYLRWDRRARRNRLQSSFEKGPIADFEKAVATKLRQIYSDLSGEKHTLFEEPDQKPLGALDIRCGSCLNVLPEIQSQSIDLVVTSPPYCNRYDYTRTYALELVYLGCDAEDIKNLRQSMLSCTVENREKTDSLRHFYEQRENHDAFECVDSTFTEQNALHEVLDILEQQSDRGDLNNTNLPRMIRNYFYEMAFTIYELSRVLKPGGRIVMVNDNVRYGGEEVPVDLILSDFAEAFGLTVEHLWTLGRGKGNSSQQMGAHGRRELRKCVYVWRKDSYYSAT